MNIVLVEPEIAPNTGTIARLCAATRSTLHLIEPLGFRLDDAQLRRAGMDYWRQVVWHRWAGWREFTTSFARDARLWFIEQGGARHYAGVTYQADDYLVFGRESAGLPRALVESAPERWLRLPILNPDARSLNLANCVAIVLYEALRQQGFPGEESHPRFAGGA
jgi:tRNA (cytidine/uridine-2'-O-)-methyltransferase